ncbi:MAG: bifunctional phosphopantothenoylcysteine decarboxylase/phosphopantothenate--cysteine ligase CoaBC [Bacteroidetes bacterium]|nr:bifunctional phosphopantothenoylcysteine decarboxylase/phosphopantothenate--cysteine ligase CoaBC [Bacteroidota bacterium]MDA1119156.1 bifunctional phosphopantothenoylcysteine decarboxylase/phosphopantothenate--cysteine ligase CoaBC [Bacteroidota bacterium]
MLRGKRILLGISGSIAAYKSAQLIRLLVKSGADVKVLMTKSAQDFITPLTLSTLSKNPVLTEFVKDDSGQWNNHVELGLWADLFLIAPATANSIAKLANGICDNLLCATYLSARCPVVFAPAMDLDMLRHPATNANMNKLISFGNSIIKTEHGDLASGLIGKGRMAEPEHIFKFVDEFFEATGPLKGKRVLVTAGPTYEAIDPVRFIGNHSSGKMGFSIAEEAANLGASVILISGPTNQKTDHPLVNLVNVTTAQEMLDSCTQYYGESNISILAAAVSDYKPASVSDQKIKKGHDALAIDLKINPDIAAELGKNKRQDQFNVGFALETENERANAFEKLSKKNFDMIVLNSLNDEGAGFTKDTNKITIIDKNNIVMNYELKNKREVAKDILQAIISRYEN